MFSNRAEIFRLGLIISHADGYPYQQLQSQHAHSLKTALKQRNINALTSIWRCFDGIYVLVWNADHVYSQIIRIYHECEDHHLSRNMLLKTMWHFDNRSLRRACAASF